MKPFVCVLLFGSLTMGTAEAADECPPGEFLKYEEIKSSRDVATQLAFLDAFQQNNKNHDQFKGSFGYNGIGINHDGVHDVENSLGKQLKIEFSSQEKNWYTIAKLSETGKAAYIECLKNKQKKNFSITFSTDAMTKTDFFIVITSHPQEALPPRLPLKVTPINAQIVRADTDDVIKNDPYKKNEALIHVRRTSLYSPAELAVRIGENKIELVSLPAKPNDLALETRKSKPAYFKVDGGQNDNHANLCVEIPNNEQDASIVKDSFTIDIDAKAIKQGVIEEFEPKKNRKVDSRRACSDVYWHLSVDTGFVEGTATAVANVAKVVAPQTEARRSK